MKMFLISLAFAVSLSAQNYVRSVADFAALKLIDPQTINPVKYVPGYGFYAPVATNWSETLPHRVTSTYNSDYVWQLDTAMSIADITYVVRNVATTNELKLVDPTTLNPVQYVMDLGFFVPKENATEENGTNTFRSSVDTNYLWMVAGGTGNISTSSGTNALSDADYGDVVVSTGGTVMTVDAGVITATKILDSTITTNKINPTFHGLLTAAPVWSTLTGVPAGFSDGIDDTGTSSVSGSASVATRSALTSLTGAANSVVRVVDDGSVWKWSASASTNAGQIYGGTSGHYWLLTSVNGWVPGTAYGLVGNGSTDNATVLTSLAALAGASNYNVFVPPGTYNVGSQVTWNNATNFIIRGAGRDKTIFYWTSTGASDEAMRWTGTGGKIRIENLALKGNPAGSHRILNQNGFYQDVQFNEVEIYAPDKLMVFWDSASRVNDFGIQRSWLHGTTVSGSSAITFGYGAAMSTNVWIVDNKIDSIGGSPIELYQIDGILIQNNTITNYGFSDTQQPHGVYGSATTNTLLHNLRIIGNRIGDNRDTDKHMGVSFIQLYDHAAPRAGIKNARVEGNYLGYGEGTSKADGLYLFGVENAFVINNYITNIHSVGIAFGEYTKDITVDGNSLYGANTAEYGIKVGATSTSGYVSSGHIITRNRIQGFLRDHIGFGGKGGVYSDNLVLLTCGALEANYSAIQLAPFTGYAVDLTIKNNVVHDLTSSPTYSWGGISMGKAARTLTNLTTVYSNSASTTSGHLIQNNVLNDVAGAPITAGSGNKVYENTRLGTTGANAITGTARNND